MATKFSFIVNRTLSEEEENFIKQMIGSSILRSITFYEDGVVRCESSGNMDVAENYEKRKRNAQELSYSIGASGENIKIDSRGF